MRRFAILLPLSIALLAGCSIYRSDLDRARRHYETNKFENALALFRVLEQDYDSYSTAEQAQYCYLRGMTDYRLSSVTQQGTGVADPRQGFRDNARHWLALAAAIEKATPGGITAEEKQRIADALADLNKDVYTGAEALPENGGEAGKGAAGPPCTADKDCQGDQICDKGHCMQPGGAAPPAAPAGGKKP